MKDIRVISGDDWVGLYIEGKLEAQGHSVSLADFAEAIDVKIDVEHVDDAGQEYLDRMGYFPDTLKEWRGKPR